MTGSWWEIWGKERVALFDLGDFWVSPGYLVIGRGSSFVPVWHGATSV